MARKTIQLPSWEHPAQKKPGVHNALHHAAAEMASGAIVCIALAGSELERAREKCPHGEWLKWVKANCEYSDDTARRYMQIWSATRQKIKFRNAAEFERIVNTPIFELSVADRKKLASATAKSLNGQELIDIYRELGICKKNPGNVNPSKRGAAKPPKDVDWSQWATQQFHHVRFSFDEVLDRPTGPEKPLQKTAESRLEATARLLPLKGAEVSLQELLQRAEAAAGTLRAVYDERKEDGE